MNSAADGKTSRHVGFWRSSASRPASDPLVATSNQQRTDTHSSTQTDSGTQRTDERREERQDCGRRLAGNKTVGELMDSATLGGTMWWWLCRRRFLPRVTERVATVVSATARIAVAAQIDLLYSPVGANVHHHPIHGSVSPYLSPPPQKKTFLFCKSFPP